MSEEEKANVAVCSYLNMQISCREALGIHELQSYMFQSRQEEKAYYNELKSQGGIISEEGGKYAFVHMEAGTAIDMDSIDEALAETQERINSMLAPPNGDYSFVKTVDKVFRQEAAIFSAATGISDDALILDDDSFYKIRAGMTEENYLEKTKEAMDLIRERSEGLSKVMGEYMERNPYAKKAMQNIDKLLKNDPDKDTMSLADILVKYHKEFNSAGILKSNLIFDLTSKIDQEVDEKKNS